MATYLIIEHDTSEVVTEIEVSDHPKGRHPIQVGLVLTSSSKLSEGGRLNWRILEIDDLDVRVEPVDLREYMVQKLALVFSALTNDELPRAQERLEEIQNTIVRMRERRSVIDGSFDIHAALKLVNLV